MAIAGRMSNSLGYRYSLACLAIGILFTYAADHLFAAGLVSFPPLYPILGLVALGLPLLLVSESGRGVWNSPLLPWCGLSAAILVVSFQFSSQSELVIQLLETRALALVTLLALVLVFGDRRVHRPALLFLLAAVLLAVAFNVYELFRPGAFSDVPGRAAGLYGNPNISGAALVLGMILTAGLLGPRWRPRFVLLIGLGVLLTLSRAAILGWLLVTGMMLWQRRLALRGFLTSAAGAAALLLGLLLLSGSWGSLMVLVPAAVFESWGRLGLGTEYGIMAELSAAERISVAREAWKVFANHPLVGGGLGATTEWSLRASTHNIYLQHVAEFGILGLVIVPWLAIAVVWRATKESRPMALQMAAFLLFWGAFSHNMLDKRTFLIAIALTSAMVVASRGESGQAVGS